MGRRLGTGESVPFESFHHMEAFRSASRAAIGRRSDAHFLYWQGRPALKKLWISEKVTFISKKC